MKDCAGPCKKTLKSILCNIVRYQDIKNTVQPKLHSIFYVGVCFLEYALSKHCVGNAFETSDVGAGDEVVA